MWVRFAYPDLSMMLGAGKVPEALRAVGLARVARELVLLMPQEENAPAAEQEPKVDEEKLAQNAELNHWLLTQMVRFVSEDGEHWQAVELTIAEASELPSEDKLILWDLAERVRDTDARGVVMGVTPIGRFTRFLHAHRRHDLCGPDCPGCRDLENEARSLPPVLGAV